MADRFFCVTKKSGVMHSKKDCSEMKGGYKPVYASDLEGAKKIASERKLEIKSECSTCCK